MLLEIRKISDGFHGVFATEKINCNEKITNIDGLVKNFPNRYTLQVGENLHVDCGQNFPSYMNHSCDPTAYINCKLFTICALRDILPDEEITFDYNTTEFDMSEKIYPCLCGANGCLGQISGWVNLSTDMKEYYLTKYPFGISSWYDSIAIS